MTLPNWAVMRATTSREQITKGDQQAADLVEALDRVEMTRILRSLPDDDRADIIGAWSATVIGKSVGTGTIGIVLLKASQIQPPRPLQDVHVLLAERYDATRGTSCY